jgi:hypothetical protein
MRLIIFPVMAPVFPCYASENSLLRVRREFASKPLLQRRAPIGSDFVKFPVIFPVSREFGVETGSLETGSTANGSAIAENGALSRG